MSLNALDTLLEVFFSIICQDRHTDTQTRRHCLTPAAHVHRGNNKDYKGQYNAWGTGGNSLWYTCIHSTIYNTNTQTEGIA